MNWIKYNEQKPQDGQQCLTRYKHHLVSGYYCAADEDFQAYIFGKDKQWCSDVWMPIDALPPFLPNDQTEPAGPVS